VNEEIWLDMAEASAYENQQQGSVTSALDGLRVLDLSRVLAGPICGQTLADLGADVIKVERPRVGDDSRAWGPPFAKDRDGKQTSESAFYCSCNRGKRSITVDLTKPEGRELVQKIAAKSDVLIENYKVGTLERYGLGYETLSRINPKLIYCSITGFGQTGPYSSRPGYDTIVQAMGGLMSVTGQPDGAPGGAPVRVGIAVTDFMTGLYATIAIQAALAFREKTGLGQYIDLSLLDVQISALSNVAMNYLISGEVPKRRGNRLPTVYPSDAFQCEDGYLMLIIGNDEQFKRFCAAAHLESVIGDERFETNEMRVKNADMLGAQIAKALGGRPVAEWMHIFEKANVPCSPINDIAQVFDDPHVRAREMKIELDHPLTGKLPNIANPMRLSRSAVQYHRPPPTLGEHTNEVLDELLDLSAEEISNLAAKGVI
jgi:crotonobetainyl-CoA:carnitine CoA-transferase CaiB-like acyl-CoA transferase